jgi:cation-transporting ATPase I
MTSVTGSVLGLAADLAAPAVRLLGRPPARRWATRPGRTHLEVRGLDGPEQSGGRRLLVKELQLVPGVRAAVVNAVLGRVVVDHDPDVAVAALVRVVEEVEDAHGLARTEPVAASAHHPADGTGPTRQAVALLVDLAGLGVVGVERTLATVPVSAAVPPLLSGALSLLDAVPALRSTVERVAGGSSTESWFSLGSATVQAVARGPVGLVADACYRGLKLGEAAGRRAAWDAFDREAGLDEHHADAAATPARPVPLRSGPVERVGDTAGALAVGGLGVAGWLAPQRAAAVLLAGVPKAARWGREAYAAAAHRALCADGVVVMDPTALRRADRTGVVLLDAAVAGRPGVREAAASAGRVVETATPSAQTVADLQRDGHGVVVVTGVDADALHAADVGVGVGADAPWTADLRCRTTGQVRATLRAVAAAPSASRRAAALAVLGSLAGAPIALTGMLPGLGGRASFPVTLGALASLLLNGAGGTWAAWPDGGPAEE